ncbi:MAG: hypothetical protein ABSE92_04830 [Terriglobales bacterium]|jgi:hypothetical protein
MRHPQIAAIIALNPKTELKVEGKTEMNQPDSRESTDISSRLIDLLVEYRIKLDAMEHVLKEINPLVHELYLGTIENLQAKKTAELKRILSAKLTLKLNKG